MGWQNEQTCLDILDCGEEWEKIANEAEPCRTLTPRPLSGTLRSHRDLKRIEERSGGTELVCFAAAPESVEAQNRENCKTSLICLEQVSYSTVLQEPINVKHYETFITKRKTSTVPFMRLQIIKFESLKCCDTRLLSWMYVNVFPNFPIQGKRLGAQSWDESAEICVVQEKSQYFGLFRMSSGTVLLDLVLGTREPGAVTIATTSIWGWEELPRNGLMIHGHSAVIISDSHVK